MPDDVNKPATAQTTTTAEAATTATTTTATDPATTSTTAAPAPDKTTAITAEPAVATTTEKPATEPVATKIVPEKYDVKAPEGSKLSAADIEKITAAAKTAGMSNDEAQAQLNLESTIVDKYHAGIQAKTMEDALAKTETQSKGWLQEAQNDPVIGGAKFQESVLNAQKFLKATDGDGKVKQLLNDTGLGNHPAIIKMFAEAGKRFADDKFVNGGAAPSVPKSAADVLYDNTPKQ